MFTVAHTGIQTIAYIQLCGIHAQRQLSSIRMQWFESDSLYFKVFSCDEYNFKTKEQFPPPLSVFTKNTYYRNLSKIMQFVKKENETCHWSEPTCFWVKLIRHCILFIIIHNKRRYMYIDSMKTHFRPITVDFWCSDFWSSHRQTESNAWAHTAYAQVGSTTFDMFYVMCIAVSN